MISTKRSARVTIRRRRPCRQEFYPPLQPSSLPQSRESGPHCMRRPVESIMSRKHPENGPSLSKASKASKASNGNTADREGTGRGHAKNDPKRRRWHASTKRNDKSPAASASEQPSRRTAALFRCAAARPRVLVQLFAKARRPQQAHIRSTHGLDQDPNDRAGYSGGYSQVRLIDHNIIVPRLPALNSKELPMRRRTAILT